MTIPIKRYYYSLNGKKLRKLLYSYNNHYIHILLDSIDLNVKILLKCMTFFRLY